MCQLFQAYDKHKKQITYYLDIHICKEEENKKQIAEASTRRSINWTKHLYLIED